MLQLHWTRARRDLSDSGDGAGVAAAGAGPTPSMSTSSGLAAWGDAAVPASRGASASSGCVSSTRSIARKEVAAAAAVSAPAEEDAMRSHWKGGLRRGKAQARCLTQRVVDASDAQAVRDSVARPARHDCEGRHRARSTPEKRAVCQAVDDLVHSSIAADAYDLTWVERWWELWSARY